MYLDAVIVVALIILSVGWFRKFSKLVYAVAIIDLFLRLIDYIANHIGIKEFKNFINSVFPNSIPDVISNYCNGLLYDILVWIYIIIMVFFLGYTFRIFLKKKF